MELSAAQVDTCLKYTDLPLPRHTSYPVVPFWKEPWSPSEYRADLAAAKAAGEEFGLYVHVPYCRSLCYYCACNKEIVSDPQRAAQDPSDAYLDTLGLELAALGGVLGRTTLRQVHLGGGTPTFLAPDRLVRLWELIQRHFDVASGSEVAAEVDPRVTGREHLETLRRLGFNRLSFGIQDFNADAQAMVNRIQPFEMVRDFTALARAVGFPSINFDLIYGLPGQSAETMRGTLDKVLELAPDRIAFYRLAVIPEIFKWQRTFSRKDLPRGRESLGLMIQAVNRFTEAGYRFIGLDHFARPDEGLAKAMESGGMQRTFQGMTTGRGLVNLGVGPSAISNGPAFFAQNAKGTKEWRALVEGESKGLATVRGMRLSQDDRIRAELLQELYGYAAVRLAALGDRMGFDARRYLAREWETLGELEAEGFVTRNHDDFSLTATDLGRLMLRVIGAVFDAYLPPDAWKRGIGPTQASSAG